MTRVKYPKELLYATGNPAKLTRMRNLLRHFGVRLFSPADLGNVSAHVDECGTTPLENARIKAQAYWTMCGLPVFACDTGLHFDGVNPEEQPGVLVRRLEDKRMDDDAMIAWYASLAQHHGGQMRARYENAIWLILDKDTEFGDDSQDLWGSPFIISSHDCGLRKPGFPLDSLSINLTTGEYYLKERSSDPCNSKQATEDMPPAGFERFFRSIFLEQQQEAI